MSINDNASLLGIEEHRRDCTAGNEAYDRSAIQPGRKSKGTLPREVLSTCRRENVLLQRKPSGVHAKLLYMARNIKAVGFAKKKKKRPSDAVPCEPMFLAQPGPSALCRRYMYYSSLGTGGTLLFCSYRCLGSRGNSWKVGELILVLTPSSSRDADVVIVRWADGHVDSGDRPLTEQ